MEDKILEKLNTAWSYGCTDAEACVYADITMLDLKEIFKDNPTLKEERRLLKKKPNIKARMNIVDSINAGNLDTSKWYAERKMKDEFSTKQVVEEDASKAQEKLKEMDKFLEKFNYNAETTDTTE